MLNEVVLIGRMGNDPEVGETKNGTKVVTISLPLFHAYTQEGRKTEWIQCRAFGKLGSIVEMGKKGVLVTLRGEIHNPTWESEEGNRRSRTYIVIDSFRFLEKRKEGDEGNEVDKIDIEINQNTESTNHPKFLDEDIDSFLNGL